MRLYLVEIFVVLAVATIIAAVVFRSQRAKGMIHVLLKVAYAYIFAVFLLAAFRIWQMM